MVKNKLPDFSDFAASINDPRGLMKVYSEWLDGIFFAPLWSPSSQEGFRIPWRKFVAAYSSRRAMVDKPGLYLFGSEKEGPRRDLPRYVGATGFGKRDNTLWKRIKGRYVPGPRTARYRGDLDGRLPRQCEIADFYGYILTVHGIEDLPGWLKKRVSKVRLHGAGDFAKHGIDGIWVAVLPSIVSNGIATQEAIDKVEKALISTARQWNCRNHYPCLVNVRPNHECCNAATVA